MARQPPSSALSLLNMNKGSSSSDLGLLLNNHDDKAGVVVECDALRLRMGLTEIFGPAGSGKTQLGLGLCVSTSMTKSRSAVYLSLGNNLSSLLISKRLRQMVDARASSNPSELLTILKRILVLIVRNEDELLDLVSNKLPLMTTRNQVGVVVLDSIAAMFRTKERILNVDFVSKRSAMLFLLAAKFKTLSMRCSVPIAIINEVSCRSNGEVVPALGLAWANCVNHSIELSRTEGGSRRLSILRSPCQRIHEFYFQIEEQGAILASTRQPATKRLGHETTSGDEDQISCC